MKTVKSLLLGSAAGFVAVVGAQAADFPVKAKPVEYVKICTLYGAGFYYVPGSDTCLKLGAYFRYQQEWDASGGRPYLTGANARYTRTDTPDLEHRIRVLMSWDSRTQTEYGTLRVYFNGGYQIQYPNESANVDWYRGFLQWAGFTVGLATSFFDFFSIAPYSYSNNSISTDMGATGQTVFAYTYQFGNGVSATLSFEDGGASAAGSAGQGSKHRGKTTVDLSQGGLGLGSLTPDNGSYSMPDVVGNIRVDQAWGSAQLAGALTLNKGGYWSGGVGACGLVGNNTTCNHPDDELGFAISGGLLFKLPTGQGDTLGGTVTYGKGAAGYMTRHGSSWRIWQHGDNNTIGRGSIGVGWNTDFVFANPGVIAGYDGSQELTSQWAIQGGFQHFWSPQWRTSLWGGYASVEYTDTAKNLMCSTTVPGVLGTPRGTAGLQVTNCDPDYSWWQLGTRTMWTPHPYVNIGLEVMWNHLNTAHKGLGATTAADGARPAQLVSIEDQDVITVMGRWEYSLNF